MGLDIIRKKTETALHYLQKCLNSLARVTLQNRKDLDLLFMEQGGIEGHLGKNVTFM